MANKIRYSIRYARRGDIEQVEKLVNDEAKRSGALLPIRSDQVKRWIAHRLSLVAEIKKEGGGMILAHEAAHIWPKCGWLELRSSVVSPAYRGNGISSKISAKLLKILKKRYKDTYVVAFTNKAGNGKGILKALGFVETHHSEIPAEFFTIGEKYRGRTEYGYKVFILRI